MQTYCFNYSIQGENTLLPRFICAQANSREVASNIATDYLNKINPGRVVTIYLQDESKRLKDIMPLAEFVPAEFYQAVQAKPLLTDTQQYIFVADWESQGHNIDPNAIETAQYKPTKFKKGDIVDGKEVSAGEPNSQYVMAPGTAIEFQKNGRIFKVPYTSPTDVIAGKIPIIKPYKAPIDTAKTDIGLITGDIWEKITKNNSDRTILPILIGGAGGGLLIGSFVQKSNKMALMGLGLVTISLFLRYKGA